jgi:hypothetical protein
MTDEKKCLMISKGSEKQYIVEGSTIPWSKEKKTKRQTVIRKALIRKLMIDQC